MRRASGFISVFLAVMTFTTTMVSGNMMLLLSIRQRLNTLVEEEDLTSAQYRQIISYASDEMLDASFKDHDMSYVRPPLIPENAKALGEWLDFEEDGGGITNDTVDYIRNIFGLGPSPNRPTEISRTHNDGPAKADYEGNGVVKFIGKSGKFALTTNRLYNGIWGYAKGQREYALQCNSIGLNILDVTDKPAPGKTYPVIQTITMSGGDVWRDVATEGDYAYVAAQGGSNPVAYVVNLSQLSGGAPQAPLSNPITSNNIKNLGYAGQGHTMNVGLGLLFYNNARGGCLTFSLENPMSPRYLTTINTGDCHDSHAQKIDGKDILFSSDGYRGKWSVVDITNIRTTKRFTKIGETAVYSGAYAHQSITSEDGKTLFVTEEFNKFDMAAYDVSDLTKPTLISRFQWSGEKTEGNAIVHNAGAVVGDYLLVGYYEAGLRVYDISNVKDIKEVGKYETYRDFDGDGNYNNPIRTRYNGAWNVAALPSGKILVSDLNYATFVVELETSNPTTSAPARKPTMAPTLPSSSFGPTPQNFGTGEPTGTGGSPTKTPSKLPSTSPTPGKQCEGLNKKQCKKQESCAFGKSKITVDCMAKKKKYEHNCSQYTVEDCTPENGKTKGLCEVRNQVCVHVCDDLSSNACKKKKNAGDNKKTCTNKMKNPCKKCKPKTCSEQ